MNTKVGIIRIMNILLGMFLPGLIYGQDINIKLGIRDSIQSTSLKEIRRILIHLPENYASSGKSYPVLYRLDGSPDLLFETISIVNRLVQNEEIIPEMIVVAIENTNRSRDMWPVNTKYNPAPQTAGADEFLNFIEKELIPYTEGKYRTTEDRILCGQSLSGVFTLYAFLTRPKLFKSFIASSGSFPDCEKYFKELSGKSFQQTDGFRGQCLFITNGLKDELDPEGEENRDVLEFSDSIKVKLGNRVKYKYLTYENEGHVPFQSVYDGLKYIYGTQSQVIPAQLNQTELIKQFTGTWKCELGKDTILTSENMPFGGGFVSNSRTTANGKILNSVKQLYGYDKKSDKFIIAELIETSPFIEMCNAWFTSKTSGELVITNPENAPLKFKFEFKSPDIIVQSAIMGTKVVKEITLKRVKSGKY
jgi:predicted alpha/beta superfamily hydrolase